MNEETIYRLAKPRRKGLLSLLFSRFLIIVILLALQVLFYVSVFLWLSKYTKHFYALTRILTVVMLIYLFMSGIDASAKLTWLLIIAVLPIAGAFMFLFTQANAGHRLLKKRASQLIDETRDRIPQQKDVWERLQHEKGTVCDLAVYLNRSGCFPVYGNTEVRYFPLGEDKFEAMLEELKKAERYIFMEYFIIEEGYMWGEILKILVEKAAAGVDVRVMYDGMNEISTLPANYWKLLGEKGIQAKPFAPIKPVLSSHYNYRDHRKILVIDGKTAFNGGINLADEYINRKERFGHWKDTAVMLKGDAVTSFTLMFLQMWNVDQKEELVSFPYVDEDIAASEAGKKSLSSGDGYVIPYADCPLDEYKAGESVYMDILNRADHYVHVMTPYLILDGELETALTFASLRGVDVKLILPGIPDKKGAYSLAKSHYRSLIRAGVKIYEYTPGFVHAKVVTSDDETAVVGTINFDYRSLYHHFECATYMYRTGCIPDIEKDFQETLSKCREITPETVREETKSYMLLGSIMKLIAPLL